MKRSWGGKAFGELKELKTAGLLCVRAEGREVRREEWPEPLSVGSHLPSAVSVFPIPAHPTCHQYCEHRDYVCQHLPW